MAALEGVNLRAVKATVLDADGIRRAVARMAHEVVERNQGIDRLVLAGIETRGVPLARRLSAALRELEGVEVPVVALDARAFRDDRNHAAGPPALHQAGAPVTARDVVSPPRGISVEDRDVLLVDDVLFRGRTARAAMEAIIRAGRPRSIQLAVLIDRGHRQLPVRADYVGKNVPTSLSEHVRVQLSELDGTDAALIVATKGDA